MMQTTMPTMLPKKRTYAEVLRTPWSRKEKREEKREEKKLRQVVCLLDVLKEVLEECPEDSKPIDDADDGASGGWYSLTGCEWNEDTHRGLMYDEDEEEEGREWNDWRTWGSMHRYNWYRFF